MAINFPKAEEEVLLLWQDVDAFKTQLVLTDGSKTYTFYDGPPFATGKPHYGHLLTGTIKDVVGRYWSAKGYHIERRFGWDTHGVPIEFEIDKKLGMSGPEAVRKLGIEAYNAECRAIVMKYAGEWRDIVSRMGRWIDFDNDYKTMDTTYMESEWWAFKQIFDRGDVYRSYRVMPYSTSLCTPLSNFEAQQNIKMVQDPAIVVSFPLLEQEDDNTSLLVYTTTPWTLPVNLVIAVHPDFEYVKIRDESSGNKYILLESRLSTIYKDPKTAKFVVLSRVKGSDMIGWTYRPMFDYFAKSFSDCFHIIEAPYVKADEGTGLVHVSPSFGVEDFEAATQAGVISPSRLPPCPIDEAGRFTSAVPDYEGQYVKDVGKLVIKRVKEMDRLLVNSQATRSVKVCWRSDVPLINKAISTWFIRVENTVSQMLENLESTTWVPNYIKDKRFANWLSNAKDWAVSRNRFFGTPLPLWISDDYEEVVCVGSIEELKRLSGYEGELNDIHRDKVDHITIPSSQGKGVLHRVPEVFDCWFESGSMPFASQHYPFSNKSNFETKRFPADFIAEGLDQTRGWFYTLTVLGNKLFGTSPFKNVIVNGMVLAEDGKKMSKREKNYPDPTQVIDRYGADALRMYLISSPAVRAQTLNFKESGVREVVTKLLLPLWNSYRYFADQAAMHKKLHGTPFVFDPSLNAMEGGNVMDRWVLANTQSLLEFIAEEMANYRLYTVLPRLRQMIKNLTNWYIHCNRKRLKGTAGFGDTDTIAAINTLFEVLFTLIRALAPFMPFLTEHIYQLLRPHLPTAVLSTFTDSRSVHFLPFPEANTSFLNPEVERQVATMQRVIELARTARERSGVGLKTPLPQLVVVADEAQLADIEPLAAYVKEELNVREVLLSTDEDRFGVRLRAVPDWPKLGKKYKKAAQGLKTALPELSNATFRAFLAEGKMIVNDLVLTSDDLSVMREVVALGGDSKYQASVDGGFVVLLDTTANEEQVREGLAREVVRQMNRLRRDAKLTPTDEVRMILAVLEDPHGVDLPAVLDLHRDMIHGALRGSLEVIDPVMSSPNTCDKVLLEETFDVNGLMFALRLV